MVAMEEMLDWKFSQVFGERTDGEEVQEERSQDWKSRGLPYLLSLIKQLPRGSSSTAKQIGLKALEFALSICDTVDMYGFIVDQEWTRYFSASRQGHTPLQCRSKLIYAAYSMCKIILHIFNGHKTKEGENQLKTDSKKRKAIETAGLQKTTQTEIDTKIPTKKQKYVLAKKWIKPTYPYVLVQCYDRILNGWSRGPSKEFWFSGLQHNSEDFQLLIMMTSSILRRYVIHDDEGL